MAGLSEKVFPFLFHKSDQNAKGARSQTTASGSTTRVRGVAFSSVAEIPGGGQPTLMLDQSENLLPALRYLSSSGGVSGSGKVQMGRPRPCSLVAAARTKVPTHPFFHNPGCSVQTVAGILTIVVFAFWLYQQSFTSV